MKTICFATILLCANFALAQTTQPSLKLIPTPQQIQMLPGRCSVHAKVKVSRVQQPIGKANLNQSYELIVSPDSIEIQSGTDAGIFYARQTLEQLERANSENNTIPCCRIIDWPALQYRVWQDDISRGPIPSMDFIKREIRTLASFKYNAMTLYTEHVFVLKKHPDIAPPDGLTAQQVQELVEYAKPYHVEIIGNFQSFGHMAHILSLPAYKDLGDNDWNISPAKEASYKFLADVYSEIAPAYQSKLFDINCDEVSLGKEGASKALVEKLGLAEVYAMHINRLATLLRPYGKTPMMWGDIATQHPDIVPKLPKDLIVLSWGYGAADSFDKAIEPFVKIGLRFMVCPGVSCWNRIFPDYNTAIINISNYVRDGVRHGAIGMVNTSWDDDGEDFFNNTWYPFVWGAEVSWNPVMETGDEAAKARDARLAQFDSSFAANFFGAPDDSIVTLLHQLDHLRDNPVADGLADGAFWRDLFDNGSFKPADAQALADGADKIAAELEAAKKTAHENADTINDVIFAARRAGFVGRSALVYQAIQQAAREHQSALSSAGHQQLESLIAEQKRVRGEYAILWDAESRPWWLDRILEKYDRQAAELQSATHRVLFDPPGEPFDGAIEVSLLPLTAGPVHYTLDGSDPTAQSPIYSSPIHLDKTTTIKARCIMNGGPTDADEATYRTFVLPATVQTTLVQHEDYAPVRAFDGSMESFFWGHHPDAGIKAGDQFTVILQTPAEFESLRVITGERDHKDDFLHAGVLEISSDGKSFEQAAEFNKGVADAQWDGKKTIKAVRIRATADQDPWLIIREIELK